MTKELKEASEVLSTDSQMITFLTYYAQRNSEGTVETWDEAVERAVENLYELSDGKLTDEEYQKIYSAIHELKVIPSMRLFSMPSAAIRRCNTVIYNCSFLIIDTWQAIAEIMYLTMSGVGVGYSVENKAINRLPEIPDSLEKDYLIYDIEDNQIGWADSVQYLFERIDAGYIPEFNYSDIRPAGTPLKTKGGFASGPEPLKKFHEHTINILIKAMGRQLTSIEVHDIVNMISETAVSNGSRSGALICLFSDDDELMFNAKSEEGWYRKYPWRTYSNNSMVVNGTTKDKIENVMDRLFVDKTGDPGLFNGSKFFKGNRKYFDDVHVGVNPCGEVLLSSYPHNSENILGGGGQFCNLTSVVVKPEDTIESLEEKLYIAALIGTIQATATNFRFLREGWKTITDMEALLGVSFTGIWDNVELFEDPKLLQHYYQIVKTTNKIYAEELDINPATGLTAIKPSGNSSMLTHTSPGANVDFGRYQIRNMRVGKHSTMAEFLIENGVPYFPDPSESTSGKHIFKIPKISNAELTLETATAFEQLAMVNILNDNYCDHNTSVTITYGENEIEDLRLWVTENYDSITGLAFFPKYDQSQPYLPIQVVSKEDFEDFVKDYPELDWEKYYENGESAPITPTVECSGERCDIVW